MLKTFRVRTTNEFQLKETIEPNLGGGTSRES